MRLALIADVHGNREALEAVLDHALQQGCDRHAFLGDYVGYGADPSWVVDCVREHVARGAWAVRGNHDTGVGGAPPLSMVAVAQQVMQWSRAQLSDGQIEYLQALPLHQREGDLLFVHANAFAPAQWEYVLGRREAERSMRATGCGYTFCGHVHEPRLFHLSSLGKVADFSPTAGVGVPVLPHRRWLVLPGSAGQPRDGNPAACYATLDLPGYSLTFHRVPYDHDAAAAKIRAAGLPEVLADRLCHGQ